MNRYISSKVAARVTKLQNTTIEDEAVPLTNAIKGEIGVAEQHQMAGAFWSSGSNSGNIWDGIISEWLGNKIQKFFPAIKDSSIELTSGMISIFIFDGIIKTANDIKESTIGKFQAQLDQISNTLSNEQIWEAAQKVYKDYPELLESAKAIIFK